MLSQRGVRYLDFDVPPEAVAAETRKVRLVYDGRSIETATDKPFAVMVRRAVFDLRLAEKAAEAGAELRDGVRVSRLEQRRDGLRLETDRGPVCARAVVVAEGSHGGLKRAVQSSKPPRELLACATTTIARPPDRECGAAEFYLGAIPGGYGWVFPVEETCSVGVGGVVSCTRRPKRLLAAFMEGRGLGRPQRPPATHVIRGLGFRRRVVRGRVFLAGDAGGLADAFLGEGISYAILSGRLAGRAAAGLARGEPPGRIRRHYTEAVARGIESETRAAFAMSRLVYRLPWVFHRIFVADRRLAEKFVEIGAGRWSYTRYFEWLAVRLPASIAKTALAAAGFRR
jgi:flavin-dependent dehydrogenase